MTGGEPRARTGRRLAERQAANAARCRIPLTEWLALSAKERRDRLQQVRMSKEAKL